jgi:hypothetical protein
MTLPSTNNKKHKTEAKEDAFETVKQYLLECPHLPSTHPAIKAALEGVEQEEKRRERDAKLQRKFAQATNTLSDSVIVVAPTTTAVPPASFNSTTRAHTASPDNADDDDDDMMESEWEDVTKKEEEESKDETSFLGRELAKLAIEAISKHDVKVTSPISAIALVVHAALRSELLEFACTGIPESSSSAAGGFALPVRELKKQFLPHKWDQQQQQLQQQAECIQLRYRKNGTGAIKLIVQLDPNKSTAAADGDDQMVQVELSPANTQEPPSQILTFPLKDHVNLDSFQPALAKYKQVAPALHYKFLPVLLSKFCRTYDLGYEENDAASIPYVDNTISPSILHRTAVTTTTTTTTSTTNSTSTTSTSTTAHQVRPATATAQGTTTKPSWPHEGVPSTLHQAFPVAVSGRGHFAGDLVPAGLVDPSFFVGNDGRMVGNLMGPNHPQFMPGRMGGGPGMIGGPGTMQPRFDPVLPPGLVNIDGQPARRNRRTPGEPNPDHLPPPNSFGGDNMFM